MRYIVSVFFSLFLFVVAVAQETKPVSVDSLRKKVVADSLLAKDKLAQDTVKKETRKERKARIHAEEEREKYYYNGIKKDSARLEIEHLSRVAWRRSLMVPGWGQYTNKGLWWIKVPVIYGGFTASYLIIDYWQWYYKKFLTELDFRISNPNEPSDDPDLKNWSETGLINQKDYARRNRDLTVLLTIGWWGINVIEAYTDSMLKNRWNIGRDMTMKLSPTLMPVVGGTGSMSFQGAAVAPGLKLTMNLN